MKTLCTTLCFIGVLLASHAQTPADWWYFGDRAGVHFTASGPVADTQSVMNTNEGCATISSREGDLLFYTNGINVWDANHVQMPNGFGLYGNASSTQSAVIVPAPRQDHLYYIFTSKGCTGGGGGANYFSYSVVNMDLNGGLGDVVPLQKNIILFESSSEKCATALHTNGEDYWVIGHEGRSNRFQAFLVTEQGVQDPVVSDRGFLYDQTENCTGYMLSSHQGDRIAMTNHYSGFMEIFPFNQTTGKIGDPLIIKDTAGYGVHFSPSDRLLYVSSYGNGIRQYNLDAPDIAASKRIISTALGAGAMAEGPDGRIYVSNYDEPFLSIIHQPNIIGNACGFEYIGVKLNQRTGLLGLPNHAAYQWMDPWDFRAQRFCIGDTTLFSMNTDQVVSAHWNFGEPGSDNDTTGVQATHVYADTGSYTVTLMITTDSTSDTLSRNIYIRPKPQFELGQDTVLCEGDTITLSVDRSNAFYQWNTGHTSQRVHTQGYDHTYSVTVTEHGCSWVGQQSVKFDPKACAAEEECELEFVNVFTPNGDGVNDWFRTWNDCEIHSYVLRVYNRWGQLLHHDRNASFGWDGNANGQPSPPGVYFFMIDFKAEGEEELNTIQGSFTLVR